MDIKVIRKLYNNVCTIGEMYIDGDYFSFTLEDRVRQNGELKVFGETAIPSGTYNIILTVSPRFGREMPLLLNVPGFAGVRIHSGNTANDTEGCLLVGKVHHRGANRISRSRVAANELTQKIKTAINSRDTVRLTIIDSFRVDFNVGSSNKSAFA